MNYNNSNQESDQPKRSVSRRGILRGIGALGLLSSSGLTSAASARRNEKMPQTDPMGLHLRNEKLQFDGGRTAESSLDDVKDVVDELNRAHEAGNMEYFEKDGVIHVRPTDQLLTKIESGNYV